MKRLVPEHFNPKGRPKRPFLDQRACEKFLRTKGWVGLYGFYECPLCGKWHLRSKGRTR